MELILSIYTIICNVLVIIFVASNHNFQENAYLYVASLAVADLLVGLFYSFHVMDHIFAITENNILCKLQISVLTISSILNMVAVGMERYLRIANPFLHASWRGKRFNIMVLVIIWTIAIISVKSSYNPLRLGTVIVLVSSGIDFVNTPRLYSDRATR